MMGSLFRSVATLVATLLVPLAAQSPLAQGTAAPTSARVIVKYRADSALMRKQAMTEAGKRFLQTQALGERIGVALTAGRGITDRAHVVMAAGISSARLASRIASERDIEYAVPDERKHIVAVPNDPFYLTRAATATSGGPVVGQWYLKPPGAAGTAANTAPSAINAEQAWDITTGSPSIVVAVLDTGVRFDHPDLQGGNVLAGYDMIGADDPPANTVFATANDGNGRDPDAQDPGDWIDSTDLANPIFSGCTAENSSWHGTQTLGLIGAAMNNGIGIAGVASGAKVMPVRVLGKCGGFDSDIQAGMLWAAGIHVAGVPDNANPARVLNMSLGGDVACSQSYIDAISQVNVQGAVVVVAAGNSEGLKVGSPANCPGAIGVGGLRHVGTKVGFSDLGPEVALSAPGGNCINTAPGSECIYPIMSTSNAGTTVPIAGAAGATFTDSFAAPSLGTSFSAPLVSGTAALILSLKPSLTAAQVKAVLQSTARPFPTIGGSAGISTCAAPTTTVQDECYCTTSTCGAGMLDAHAAVLSVGGVQASIGLTTTTPTAGQPVVLTSTSVVGSGQSIASYAWSIVTAGTTGATISAGAAGPSVTVAPTAAGMFTIQLTTTDNTGFVSSATTTVTVAPVVVVTPPGGGGGGGGAVGVVWLFLLLGAVLALVVEARARRWRAAALSASCRSSWRRR